MKSQKSYSEKLRDPRWQKKRLEVLEEYGWKCHSCGSDSEEIHVHHPYYKKGLEPWEYENLLPLCDKCHKQMGEAIQTISQAISLLYSPKALELSRLISTVLNKSESSSSVMNIPMILIKSFVIYAANCKVELDDIEDLMIPQEWINE